MRLVVTCHVKQWVITIPAPSLSSQNLKSKHPPPNTFQIFLIPEKCLVQASPNLQYIPSSSVYPSTKKKVILGFAFKKKKKCSFSAICFLVYEQCAKTEPVKLNQVSLTESTSSCLPLNLLTQTAQILSLKVYHPWSHILPLKAYNYYNQALIPKF